jgi:hypothetical protein
MGFEWTFASLSLAFWDFEVSEGAAGEGLWPRRCTLPLAYG